MCPIETPEGPNIGLIGSLSTFAPGQRVRLRRDAVPQGRRRPRHRPDRLPDRRRGGPARHRAGQRAAARRRHASPRRASWSAPRAARSTTSPGTSVDYMDVSPRQMVSVATAMIPFLEHDDANRALMGSNMQRQSVPLLRSEAPLVGTGMEYRAAIDAGDVIVAEAAGVVTEVSADAITVAQDDGELPHLPASRSSVAPTRARASTSVRSSTRAQRVEAGQVLADGPCTDNGEMALGTQPARGVHAVGGPQLRGRDHPRRSASCRTTSSPRSTSRSTRSTPATPSSAPRRSPGTSRTSPRRCSPTSTSAASSASAPRSSPATSWSARSRPRARPS